MNATGQSTDITGATCTNTGPHAPHRIVGSFRGSCPGIAGPASTIKPGDVANLRPYSCAECGEELSAAARARGQRYCTLPCALGEDPSGF